MRAWAQNGEHKWGPFGFIKWVRHWQIQPVPYRLPAWAQGSTHIDNLYMGYEWEKYISLYGLWMGKIYGVHFHNPYGSDMGKHNQSYIGCLHEPNVAPTLVISIWVLNGAIHMGPTWPNYIGQTCANTINPI